jgi:serine/threonine protein kinase
MIIILQMNPELLNKNKENLEKTIKEPQDESEPNAVEETKENVDEKLKNIEETIYSMKKKMDKIIENMNIPEQLEQSEQLEQPEVQIEEIEQPEVQIEELEQPEVQIEEPEETPILKEETKERELINQGSYGCIIKPQIECDENEYDSKNYVSKIQEVSFELEKEIKIGEEIQKIENYFNNFAPILKSCNVSLNEIPYDIVNNCKIMKNSLGEKDETKTYVSNKIRYVGKYDLGKIIKMTETKKQLPILLDNHLYLLKSIEKLLTNNIIHFDLKPNNIIYDEIQGVPIIIDYGLSFNIKNVMDNPDESYYEKYFLTDEFYVFWCVEVFVISQIIYNHKDGNVNKEQLTSIMNEMIFDEYYSKILTRQDIETFKTKYTEYFSKYIDRPWKDLMIDLLKEDNYKTWDNYALCISLLFILNNNESLKYNSEEYVKLIKEIVLSMPGERIGIEETRNRLLEIVHNIPSVLQVPLVLPVPLEQQDTQEEKQDQGEDNQENQIEENQEQENQEKENQQETEEENQEEENQEEENQEEEDQGEDNQEEEDQGEEDQEEKQDQDQGEHENQNKNNL